MIITHKNTRASMGYGKLHEMLKLNWHLGFTSFGGPAAHFQIFHGLFVEKNQWIDEKMYQELFALCQALPGPGSTKMLYCINFIHCGFFIGLLSFFIWSLPGAIASYGLALGIIQIHGKLPPLVYALITGFNAATVGIIALAAVFLSKKATTDKLTRILVFLGATAGLLYNALWYFPVLMIGGGLATIIWDHRLEIRLYRRLTKTRNTKERDIEAHTELAEPKGVSSTCSVRGENPAELSEQSPASLCTAVSVSEVSKGSDAVIKSHVAEGIILEDAEFRVFTWKIGVVIVALFLITLIITMVLRTVLKNRPRSLDLFANLYLAGTIIFGGGPVVIPLLREYVVAPGWVSSRDFLLGLAMIQAFPGPNFNFAVYLGTLAAASSTKLNPAPGALIGYIAIFSPGIVLHTGAIGLWKRLRTRRWVISCLRGVNATAVGLVYTAVFRLWEMGSFDEMHQSGTQLGNDPWWMVITALSFVGGMWFKLPAPAAILLGGLMGMVWYGVVKA